MMGSKDEFKFKRESNMQPTYQPTVTIFSLSAPSSSSANSINLGLSEEPRIELFSGAGSTFDYDPEPQNVDKVTNDPAANTLEEKYQCLSSDDTKLFVKTLEAKLMDALSARQEAGASWQCTIFRVPDHICRGREDLFRPQVVSIGPYVHEYDDVKKKELGAMEVLKAQFLVDLKAPTCFVEACVQKLKELEPKIRNCYHQAFADIKSERFIEMMLLDGIFVLQYFMKWRTRDIYFAIGNVQWSFTMILHDLLLLENQIPFFVLQVLLDLFVRYKPPTNFSLGNRATTPELLVEILLDGFKAQGELTGDVDVPIVGSYEIHHLLHFYHRCFISKISDPNKPDSMLFLRKIVSSTPASSSGATLETIVKPAPRSILSASKLREAGIRFKKKKTSSNFLDVTFKDGTLQIPFISIHDRMTYKFANLIALEQSTNAGQAMTSYAVFMDKIIDTPDDVEILRYEGIIENMLASNEDVALFFNQLCTYAHLNFEKHYLAQVFRDVDEYCKSKWHEQRAWLVRNYFSNAWVFISLVAAVILLILTLVQTYFSVYGYFRPPS